MKTAVTAASGGLGTAILNELALETDRADLVAVARTPEKVTVDGVGARKGDYDHPEHFEKAFEGVDAVVLISGMDAPDRRVVQHRGIIEAAKKAGVSRIVYTSIIGEPGHSTFDPIVRSNRETEEAIRSSGLEWSIGRNGLYIEPDVDYLEKYVKAGRVANCAGDGRCAYTTRTELAAAYARMVLEPDRNGRVYNLTGASITQADLVRYMNTAFGTSLEYEPVTPEAYLEMQKEMNGDFLGPIIAGIYTKIRNGEFDARSDYQAAAGRPHVTWERFFGKGLLASVRRKALYNDGPPGVLDTD